MTAAGAGQGSNGAGVGDLRAAVSLLSSRADFADLHGFQFGGDRDLYQALGYTRNITLAAMRDRWRRGGVARRIVNAKPGATWREAPRIYEIENPNRQSRWEKAWDNLKEQHRVFSTLERLDVLAGLGRYGILLIGLRDGRPLEQPVNGVRGADGILFLQPYANDRLSIKAIEEDEGSERFGLPLLYQIKLGAQKFAESKSWKSRSVLVHWSRVLHFADEAYDDEIYGTPRLEPVWNRLDDLDKIVGGCGEMFWRGGYQGLHANIDKDAGLTPQEEEALDGQIKEWENRLRRVIQTRRVDVTALQAQIADPRGAFAVVSAMISGATGIPQRILFGSERGQLASTQDRSNWNERIAERQQAIAEPLLLRPFLERMQMLGALPEPRRPVTVEWPDLLALPEGERAQNVQRLAQAENQHAAARRSGGAVLADSELREAMGYPAERPAEAEPQPDPEPEPEPEPGE